MISTLDVVIGVGNGAATQFQLVKTFTVGSAVSSRKVYLPIVSSVLIAVDGAPVTMGWTVSRPGGVVTFGSPPGDTLVITAGYQYDIEVRFDVDRLPASLETLSSNSLFAGSIDGIQLREERR
jgi:uncharacterized protein (TIGR02217 family)